MLLAPTRAPVIVEKDLVEDQTLTHIVNKLNVGGATFDVVQGYGFGDSSTSTAFLIAVGGFPNQRIEASLKYVAPTAKGSEHIGVMGRIGNFDGDANYYFARVSGGVARITRIADGTFVNLTQTAFPLDPDVWVDIRFDLHGNELRARFEAPGLETVELSAEDEELVRGGVMGCRSLSSTLWVRSFRVEQL